MPATAKNRSVDASALRAQAQEAAIRAEARRTEARLRLERHDALMTRRERHQRGRHLGEAVDTQRQATGHRDRLARHQAAGCVCLLDHLPDLAADLTGKHAAVARRALTVPAIELTAGRCALRACAQIPG